MLPKSTGFVTVAASGECAKLVQERETREKETKEEEERDSCALPALPLVAAVDVEHFGFCIYAHRIFILCAFILLLASKLLAPGSSSMEREKRE
jgi:hypothetical protein